MDPAGRDYFPPGDLRVSDAERARALSELSDALQAGRITAEEFDERSGQVLSARTGNELGVPLADLPHDRAPAASTAARPAAVRRPQRGLMIGASVAAVCLAATSLSNALSSGPTLAQREFLQQIAARQGLSVPVPPASGFDWIGTMVPGVAAVLLIVFVVILRVPGARRG
jgi:hypothetical protein